MDISFGLFSPEITAFDLGNPKKTSLYSIEEKKSSCNCELIEFVPHAHSTHTETVHHIKTEIMFTSVDVIKEMPIQQPCVVLDYQNLHSPGTANHDVTALIVKFGLGPPYPILPPHFTEEDMFAIFQRFPRAAHLLCDLPSLDGKDDKELTCHRLFFNMHPKGTVTEMCNLANVKSNSHYQLFLVPIIIYGSDAHPCRPILSESQQ